MEKSDRYVLRNLVKLDLIYGYYIWDNLLKEETGFEYSESELGKAKSRCELMNLLNEL